MLEGGIAPAGGHRRPLAMEFATNILLLNDGASYFSDAASGHLPAQDRDPSSGTDCQGP
jgi:hypothetical protein